MDVEYTHVASVVHTPYSVHYSIQHAPRTKLRAGGYEQPIARRLVRLSGKIFNCKKRVPSINANLVKPYQGISAQEPRMR